jgi:magnesium chelatase family protein
VSGPLLDRIDLFVEVARPKQVIIPGKGEAGEDSSEVRKRVVAARAIQIARQGVTNGRMSTSGVKSQCRLCDERWIGAGMRSSAGGSIH